MPRQPRTNMPPRDCEPWLYEILRSLSEGVHNTTLGLSSITRGEVPDGSGQPLPSLDGTQFFFLPGRHLGQTGYGDTDDSGILTLSSTRSTTKGKIYLGSALNKLVIDEAQSLYGFNIGSPTSTIHIVGSLSGSGSSLTTSTTVIADNWGGSRSGAGGGGIGDPTGQSLASNDGITTYVAVLPTIDGNNPQKNALTGTIVPGGTYTITVMLACFSSVIDVTKSAWVVSLVDSAGNQWNSAASFNSSVSPFTAAEVAGMTPAQTFFAITRTITCSGTPVSTGNTANAIWMWADMKNSSTTRLYTLASYVTVTQAGASLVRWDLSGGTQSGGIDIAGRMGIGTGSASLDSELTVIPDLTTTIGLKVTAVASQTADLLRITNSGGTALSGFTSAGDPYLAANAALDALLASDASGVGAWKSLVAWEDEMLFYEDSPVYV